MPKETPHTEAYQKLNCEIEDLLRKKSSHSYSFITSVEQRIKQFRLAGLTHPDELINEAYLRALKLVERGEVIDNPKAWMRVTVFNIIREKSREQRRQQPTDPQSYILEGEMSVTTSTNNHEEDTYDVAPIPELSLDQRWMILEQAIGDLMKMKPDAGFLMYWRLIGKSSWKDIRKRLSEQPGKTPSETTLRKRASRSKRLLRKLYHQREEEMLRCWTHAKK